MFDPKTKVLVVDNNRTMRKVIIKILKELGFSGIAEASDGKEAWEKIQETTFNLILSDRTLPKGSGIELLQKMRSEESYSKTAFVMVTSESEEQHVAEAIQAGVDQYILKPFSTEGFINKLKNARKKRPF